MVILKNETVYDVVFVVESTAHVGAHIEEIYKPYIVPILEYFNGGKIEKLDFGSKLNSNLFNLLCYNGSDHINNNLLQVSPPTSNCFKFTEYFNNIDYSGGGGDSKGHVVEGLSNALELFEELSTIRATNISPQKHLLLVCNNNPYSFGAEQSYTYHGCNIEEIITVMREKGIYFSVITPSWLEEIKKLFDMKTCSTNSTNHSTKPQHMVFLDGIFLSEPLSSVRTEEVTNTQNTPSSQAPITKSVSISIVRPRQGASQNSVTKDSMATLKSVTSSTGNASDLDGSPVAKRQALGQGFSPMNQQQQQHLQQQQQLQQQQLQQQKIPQQLQQKQASQTPMISVQPQQQLNQTLQQSQQINQSLQQQPQQHNIQLQQQNQQFQQLNQQQINQQQQQITQQQSDLQQIQQSSFNQDTQNIINQPITTQKIIWKGTLDWVDKIKVPHNRISYSLSCQVSIGQNDPDVNTSKWPDKLQMTNFPAIILPYLQPYMRNSQNVTFSFPSNDQEAMGSLYKFLTNNYCCCVHFTGTSSSEASNDINILILSYNQKQKFFGLIPHDQAKVLATIKAFINKKKAVAGGVAAGVKQGDSSGSPQIVTQQQMQQQQIQNNQQQQQQSIQLQQVSFQKGMPDQRQQQFMALQQQQLQQQQLQRMQLHNNTQPLRYLLMNQRSPHVIVRQRSATTVNTQHIPQQQQQQFQNVNEDFQSFDMQ